MPRNLKTEFTVAVFLTVHWDGKLMEDLPSKEHIDLLPISGVAVEQQLSIPKLPFGTGEAQATVIIAYLQE